MSSVSCSICWEIVTTTCIASYLQCGHVYHHKCLDKWLKNSPTCPECRNAVTVTKRIYLNLVPDPEIEVLTLEITKKSKSFEFLTTDNEIQDAIIKQLEKQLSAKDEELLLSAKRNDELKSSSSCLLHQNSKLKLELELQEKQYIHHSNEIVDLKNQLQASQTKNIEITTSTVTLKEYYREQVKQISDLQAQILDLTERLDHFRAMFASTDNKLQGQVQETEDLKKERDSLLSRNIQLDQKIYSLKMQVDKMLPRKIRNKYSGLLQTSSLVNLKSRRIKSRSDFLQMKLAKENFAQQCLMKQQNTYQCRVKSSDNLKIKLVKNENLKIKLVKSKLNWTCVNS